MTAPSRIEVHIRHIVWHGEGALPPALLQAQVAQALTAHTQGAQAPATPGGAIAQALTPQLPAAPR